jgi:predicted PurR-regulated permease PerM
MRTRPTTNKYGAAILFHGSIYAERDCKTAGSVNERDNMPGIDIRTAKITFTVLLIALSLVGIYLIRSTLLIVAFSVFFAYLLLPLVQLAERYKPHRMPRSAAIVFAFLLVIGIAAIATTVLGEQIAEQAVRLEQELPKLLDPANITRHIPVPRFLEPHLMHLLNTIGDRMRDSASQALPFMQQIGAGFLHAARGMIYLVVVPILSFLFIKDGPQLRKKILSWSDWPVRPLWANIIDELSMLLASYVRALLFLALIAFACYSMALSIFGVPYALLLGGIAGLLEFIPVFGPLTAIAIILAVSSFSGYPHLLWLIGFFMVYRIFQDYMVAPYFMSEGLEVSPLFVIIGLLAGEQLGGVAGIFLAVPVIAALKIIFLRIRTWQQTGQTS